MRPRRTEREVINIISSAEVTQMMYQPNRGDCIEIRQRRDGTYRVWYPDEGWTHDTEKQPFIESHYWPSSLAAARTYALLLAEDRLVVLVEPASTQAADGGPLDPL